MGQVHKGTSTLHLSKLACTAVHSVIAHFADPAQGFVIQPNKLAISLVDLTSAANSPQGDFRGGEPFYPASIVKLFFLAAIHIKLEAGIIPDTSELQRTVRGMIIDSSNDATSYVVDLLSGTASGAPLSLTEMTEWGAKRNALNEIFVPLGYKGINICQKTWNEGPDGRDKIFLGADLENRNRLASNDVARLLTSIVRGEIASPSRSRQMMDLMRRDYLIKTQDVDDQATGFSAAGLPADTRLWSKAGWTSEVRHDAAYVELANGKRLVMVIFTAGYSEVHDLIPALTREILGALA